jgi:hypothetical protein
MLRLAPGVNIGQRPATFIEALVIFVNTSSPMLEWLLLYAWFDFRQRQEFAILHSIQTGPGTQPPGTLFPVGKAAGS